MPKQKIEKLAAAKVAVRDECRRNKMVLSHLLGYDFQEDVHEDLFANYITYDNSKAWPEQSLTKDRMILWSRGFYKTTSIIVEIIQAILNFPNIRVLLMQGTVENTKTLLAEIKSHFDGTNPKSKLGEIFPEFCSDKRLGSSLQFTVPCRTRTLKDPTVRVASPKTTKAGQHYDVGFFDDLVNESNYRNPKLIQKAIKDFSMYTPLIDPGGYRFVTGTRYAFGDLYEQVQRWNTTSNSWKITTRPCWYKTADGTLASYFPPRKTEDGRIVGISVEQLKAIEAEDPEMFASQYLNQPISVSMHLFPEDLMLGHVKSPEGIAFGYKTLFIDYSSGRDKHSDHSVILCGQQDSMNKIYCTDGVGGQWSPDQTAHAVIAMALKHKPIKIYIEKSAAGEVFVYYLREIARTKGVALPLDYIQVSSKPDAKHMRISLCSGYLKQNRLFFSPGLACWQKMLEQFVGYPRTKHDDYPDTIALMCEHYQAVAPTPIVRSFQSYLLSAEVPGVAQYILNPQHESNWDGGSLGSDF